MIGGGDSAAEEATCASFSRTLTLGHLLIFSISPQISQNTARTSTCSSAAASSAHTAVPAASSASPVIPLSNVEAMWERLSADEQLVIHQQLEEIQKKDWKTLSVDEKKAGTLRRRACPRPVSLSSTPMSPFC